MTRALSFSRAAGVLKGMERRIVSEEELRKITNFWGFHLPQISRVFRKGEDRKTRFFHFLFFNLFIFLCFIDNWKMDLRVMHGLWL